MQTVRVLLGAASAIAVSVATPASADMRACTASYEAAQLERRRGALLESRAAVETCLRECSDIVKPDCAAWLTALERDIPSIVIVIRSDGADSSGAAITVDGRPVADPSRAIELNPGTHEVVVTLQGKRSSAQTVVREGERGRRLEFDLASPTSPVLPESTRRILPWPTLVFGGIAAAGLATFGVAAIYGEPLYQDLNACQPRCQPEDVDAVRTTYLVADVGLVVALLSGAAAATSYFLMQPRPAAPHR